MSFLRALFLLAAAASFAARAQEASWMNKPAEKWTTDDAKQVLADSPWAKMVQLQIVRDLSPDERRAGGDMQADQGKGIGLAALVGIFNPQGTEAAIERAHEKPDPGKVMVRWESARPVRAAETKVGDAEAPPLDGDYYAIVVYNIATPKQWNIERELRGIAALKREKAKDLKPSRVTIIRKSDDRANVVYLFPRSAEISKRDAYVAFQAQIGRLVLWQVFLPREMQIQGQLEL